MNPEPEKPTTPDEFEDFLYDFLTDGEGVEEEPSNDEEEP